jgi:hypothetical protein
VGGQLRAFRYFEMKLLPWECFLISPLIMMGRNNEYSSQNSRNRGNKGRKTKAGRTGPKERISQLSQNSALAAFEENVQSSQVSSCPSKGQVSYTDYR